MCMACLRHNFMSFSVDKYKGTPTAIFVVSYMLLTTYVYIEYTKRNNYILNQDENRSVRKTF